jgi:hypothetical protein
MWLFRNRMKTVSLGSAVLILDGIERVEADENFTGKDEELLIFAEGADTPVRIVVSGAAQLEEEIMRLLECD